MATNEILPFASTDTGTNLLTQSEYSSDSQRAIGNQPGIARSKLVNKALRQSSTVAAGVAQYMANKQATNLIDSLTPAQIATILENAVGAQINAATGSLGTLSSQNANAVAITGGTITGITDLAIADGGTGASTAAQARTNLGLGSLATLSGVGTNEINNASVTVAKLASGLAPIGADQSWQAVSRSLNTTYTNTTGRTIAVWASGSTVNGINGDVININVGGVFLGGNWAFSGAVPVATWAIVPPGATYRFTTRGYTTSFGVVELR